MLRINLFFASILIYRFNKYFSVQLFYQGLIYIYFLLNEKKKMLI